MATKFNLVDQNSYRISQKIILGFCFISLHHLIKLILFHKYLGFLTLFLVRYANNHKDIRFFWRGKMDLKSPLKN
jgi:hypothetical protein